MKAKITYSPPFLNAYQNVPFADSTTTRTRARGVTVIGSNQGNASLGNGNFNGTAFGSWSFSSGETRINIDGGKIGANMSNSCCQLERENARQHARPHSLNCQRANHGQAATANGRERRKTQCVRGYIVNPATQRACVTDPTTTRITTFAREATNMRETKKWTIDETTRREISVATIITATCAYLKAVDVETCRNTVDSMPISPEAPSASPSPAGTHAVSSTIKTPPSLEDNFRISNNIQLVMPIVENRLGNIVETQLFHKTPVDRTLMMQAQRLNPDMDGSAKLQIQSRQRIYSRPLCASLKMGIDGVFKAFATTIHTEKDEVGAWVTFINTILRTGAAVMRNTQTTTTLDCRLVKENGDICTANVQKTIGKDENLDEFQHNGTVCGWTNCKDRRMNQRRKQQRLSILPVAPLLQKRTICIDSAGMPPWRTSFLVLALLMLTLATPAKCWTGRQDVASNCTFPARWEGSWFLSGYQQSIHIKGAQFSYRGKCAASDGNKYLIVDEKGCHRCLVIYEKHKNVLQYKESECEGDSMYMHQTNPSAMAMRSVLKQSEHRGGAHPNLNSNNGHSRLSSSDQYIMRSNDDMNDCPPDFCKGRETLQNLCDQIPGDALLYSLFRESAEPVKCPLKGPFIFTYNRGHGECKSPVSNIESCTEDSRLLLSFQACPDVQGTESTIEELTCLATWKDGNSRYLVGLVSHHHAISNEERYRCFVYEKISSLMGGPSIVSSKDAEYKLAQSGDATCNGLDSAEVGSRIMSLRKPPPTERCDFPAWFKGPRHWHVLMGNAVYNYHPNDGSVHIIKPNGFMETRALCEQINKQTSTEMIAVVHYTTGCQSGFMCMMFYRRDTHVIEIQTGKQASRLEDACAPDHFDVNRMPYITLLASNPDPQICPLEGLYNLRGAIGPPYLSTRHKRNHNNKMHFVHAHRHIQSEFIVDGAATVGSRTTGNGNENNGYAPKRHATLSFRNTERTEKGSWHANTRGLAARIRRATLLSGNISSSHGLSGISALAHMKILEEYRGHPNGPVRPGEYELTMGKTMVGFIRNATEMDQDLQRQRSRRDAPGCVINYKSQRRLWMGCTEPDVIDVRPLCNDDGDEEYSCHGSWSENGTVYIITRHKGTKHGVCLTYRSIEGTSAKLVIGDACYRGTQKPPDHHLIANLTVFGKCGETGSAALQLRPNATLMKLAVAIWALMLIGWLTPINYRPMQIVNNQR